LKDEAVSSGIPGLSVKAALFSRGMNRVIRHKVADIAFRHFDFESIERHRHQRIVTQQSDQFDDAGFAK
jgi:hypothetical protein